MALAGKFPFLIGNLFFPKFHFCGFTHHRFTNGSFTNLIPRKYEPRKKKLLLSMKSWLVNRDPYSGLLESLYNWVGFHPLYQITNQVFFLAHMTLDASVHQVVVFIQLPLILNGFVHGNP